MIDLCPWDIRKPSIISKAVTLIENGGAETGPLLNDIYKSTVESLRIGITGPPGAGEYY